MKKLIKQIALFLIPVFIGLIVLPVNKRTKYVELKDDCFNHGIWVYDRIHNNPGNVDIAILGSSHTVNGINDELISEQLDTLVAANFGYCRFGRNMHYTLLKEVLSEMKISKLVVEVREGENRYSHPIYPFVVETKDVFLDNSIANREVVQDIWSHLAYKVELFQDKLYHQSTQVGVRNEAFGFASHADTASAKFLDEVKARRSSQAEPMTEFQKRVQYKLGRVFHKKIAELCKKKNVEIYYLFMPSYGSGYAEPKEMEFYQQYGTVLIPPTPIYDNQDNWWDEGHLNIAGANKLSEWLASQLIK